jgi:hypothetical protein
MSVCTFEAETSKLELPAALGNGQKVSLCFAYLYLNLGYSLYFMWAREFLVFTLFLFKRLVRRSNRASWQRQTCCSAAVTLLHAKVIFF